MTTPFYRGVYALGPPVGLQSEVGMANRPGFDSLDSAKYLYLRELSEPRDNSLRLVVQEAVVNPVGSAGPYLVPKVQFPNRRHKSRSH